MTKIRPLSHMMDKESLKEIMAAFTLDDITRVSERMSLVNQETSDVNIAGVSYWYSDMSVHKIEGTIQIITVFSGALRV